MSYCLTDERAQQSAASLGFGFLSSYLSQQVLDKLRADLMCEGRVAIADTKAVRLTGGGSSYLGQFFPLLANTYAYLQLSMSITFSTSLASTHNFLAADYPSLPGTTPFASNASNALMFPIIGLAVTPIVHIPELPPGYFLLLNRATLAAIYAGSVTTWNDSSITATNPTVQLPGAKIIPVFRTDDSGVNYLFASALKAFAPLTWSGSLTKGRVIWPDDLLSEGENVTDDVTMDSTVSSESYTIGYVDYMVTSGKKYTPVRIIQPSGTGVVASKTSLRVALDDFGRQVTNDLLSSTINTQFETGWPISGYSYMVVPRSTYSNSTANGYAIAQATHDFLKWVLFDSLASSIIASAGFVEVPLSVKKASLALLDVMECDGKRIVPFFEPTKLYGAGVGDASDLFAQWAGAYEYADGSVSISYSSDESVNKTLESVRSGSLDFAVQQLIPSVASWVPPNMTAIPVAGVVVVPAFNIPSVTSLILTRSLLADIFLGRIATYNDSSIRALNPNVNLPNKKIIRIITVATSSLSRIFIKSLSVFTGSEVTVWPPDAGISSIMLVSSDAEASSKIKATPYSIGYTSLAAALIKIINAVSLVSKSGDKITPTTPLGCSYSLSSLVVGPQGVLSLDAIDTGSAGGWPMCALTQVLVPSSFGSNASRCDKWLRVGKFLLWAVQDQTGQTRAQQLGFASLPSALKSLAINLIRGIECNSSTPLSPPKRRIYKGVSDPHLADLVSRLSIIQEYAHNTSRFQFMTSRPSQTPQSFLTDTSGTTLVLTDVIPKTSMATTSYVISSATSSNPQRSTSSSLILPVFATGAVLVYNLGHQDVAPVVALTPCMLSSIFAGSMLTWGAVPSAQSNVTLRLIRRSDTESQAVSALAQYVTATCPMTPIDGPHILSARNGDEALSLVESFFGSISVIEMALSSQARLPWAQISFPSGTIAPTSTTILKGATASLKQNTGLRRLLFFRETNSMATRSSSSISHENPTPGPTPPLSQVSLVTWPLSYFTYIILPSDMGSDVTRGTDLVDLTYFLLTDPSVLAVGASVGMVSLSGDQSVAIRELVLSSLSTLSANGSPVKVFLCGPGYRLNVLTSKCDLCPVGTFTSSYGETSCRVCEAGSYASEIGSSKCTLCAPGSLQFLSGQASCALCPKGEFNNEVGQVCCSKCGSSDYADHPGYVQCKKCPLNSETGKLSATTISDCKCMKGFYGTITSETDSCIPCPTAVEAETVVQLAYCPGGDMSTVRVAEGYWRRKAEVIVHGVVEEVPISMHPLPCPSHGSCLGCNMEKEHELHEQCVKEGKGDCTYAHCEHEECFKGASGPLCSICLPNYYYKIHKGCLECMPPAQAWGVLVGVLVLVLAVGLLLLREARMPHSNATAVTKILMNYLHVNGIVLGFDLQFPRWMLDFVEWQSNIAAANKMFGLQCLMPEIDFYAHILGYVLLPVIVAFVLFIVQAIKLLLQMRRGTYSKDVRAEAQVNFVMQMLIFLYMYYPTITDKVLEAFQCAQFDEPGWSKKFLEEDFRVDCDSDAYKTFRGTVIAPALLVYCIGIPLLFFGVLYKGYRVIWREQNPLVRSKLKHELRHKYNFLMGGFKHSCFYYETVILLRKFALVFAMVFLAEEVFYLMITDLFLLEAALMLHFFLRPYTTKFCMILEGIALSSLVVEVAFSLLQSGHISADAKSGMGGIFVSVNVLVLFLFLFLFIRENWPHAREYFLTLVSKKAPLKALRRKSINVLARMHLADRPSLPALDVKIAMEYVKEVYRLYRSYGDVQIRDLDQIIGHSSDMVIHHIRQLYDANIVLVESAPSNDTPVQVDGKDASAGDATVTFTPSSTLKLTDHGQHLALKLYYREYESQLFMLTNLGMMTKTDRKLKWEPWAAQKDRGNIHELEDAVDKYINLTTAYGTPRKALASPKSHDHNEITASDQPTEKTDQPTLNDALASKQKQYAPDSDAWAPCAPVRGGLSKSISFAARAKKETTGQKDDVVSLKRPDATNFDSLATMESSSENTEHDKTLEHNGWAQSSTAGLHRKSLAGTRKSVVLAITTLPADTPETVTSPGTMTSPGMATSQGLHLESAPERTVPVEPGDDSDAVTVLRTDLDGVLHPVRSALVLDNTKAHGPLFES